MAAAFGAGSPTRGDDRMRSEIAAAVKVQMRNELQGMIEEAIRPVRDVVSAHAHSMSQIDAALEMQKANIEQLGQNTGQLLSDNLRKADEVLSELKGQINQAGTIAVDGQQRIEALIVSLNAKARGNPE